MEVLTAYPSHQLGTGLSSEITPRCLFSMDSSKICANAEAITEAASSTIMEPPRGITPSYSDGGQHNTSELEDDLKSDNKEEVDSDARDEESHIVQNEKHTPPKEKDLSQMAYLLSSLPALSQLFELHRKIGEGTFSSVFLATLKNIPSTSPFARKQFAVKHLIPTTHPTRAERELKCLQDIGGCDNVVGVNLCLRNQDSIAFIMPYLPHKRFSEYVMHMGVKETRNYMKQLLLALRRVHSFNIIHRDVKPSNFLYDRESKQFLLVDFGLSQPVEETSLKSPSSPVLSSNARKRKRDKECTETGKGTQTTGITENVAKRQALAPCNTNVLNSMKTPEKVTKLPGNMNFENKSLPYFTSNRAKSLQNISFMNAFNISSKRCAPTNTNFKQFLKSPCKDGDPEYSQATRKTPRKNKMFGNENALLSPLKNDGGSHKKPFGFGGNKIWKDDPPTSNEKHALDLRKVKADSEAKKNGFLVQTGMRNTLQRKILFDDVPGEEHSRDDKMLTRSSLMTPRRSMVRHSSQHPSPLGTPLPVSGVYSDSPASKDLEMPGSPMLSPTEQNSTPGNREFLTLVPDRAKEVVPGSSIIRVQNSQVKSKQLSPITPSETRKLKLQPQEPKYEKEVQNQNVVFAKPQAPGVNGSLHRSSTPSSPQCSCHGRPQVCSLCLARKPHNAPRAGTPGFRPPEVLLRSPIQTTAVDMWAVGVILLCILSGCYPFFRSPDDLTALAEIMTVFGTDKLKQTAVRLGRMVVCSQPSRALDLKKLCSRMRQRRKDKVVGASSATDNSGEKCQNCCQLLGIPDCCICQKDVRDALSVNAMEVNNVEESDDIFPDSAYHLLARLLDLNADTRITAAEALQHPFITGLAY